MADTKNWRGFSIPVKMEGSQFKDMRALLRDMVNAISKSDKELKFILNNVDSSNVTELNTNITNIQSEDGETVIDGPLLKMYDDTPTLRLEMGYDEDTTTFVFKLYNDSGTETISIDSNGDAIFNGNVTGTIDGTSASTIESQASNSVQQDTAYNTVKITSADGIVAQRSDNKARTSIAGGEILIEKGDGTGTTWEDTFYIDSNGDAVFKGKVEIGATYPITIEDDSNFGKIRFYDNASNITAQFLYSSALTSFLVSTGSSTDLGIASAADFDLTAATDLVLTVGSNLKINGGTGATGTFTTADSKTVTVTKGIITSIV